MKKLLRLLIMTIILLGASSSMFMSGHRRFDNTSENSLELGLCYLVISLLFYIIYALVLHSNRIKKELLSKKEVNYDELVKYVSKRMEEENLNNNNIWDSTNCIVLDEEDSKNN